METIKRRIQCNGTTIHTTITSNPVDITNWINAIKYVHKSKPQIMIGLDAEGKGNSKNNQHTTQTVATLQLCVENRCIIIKLRHMNGCMPCSLLQFMQNPRHVFAGVEVASDAANLKADYGIVCENLYDIRKVARGKLPEMHMLSKCPGLKELAATVAGLWLEKPKHVTLSFWWKKYLSEAQIEYACIDAFASFKVAEILSLDLKWCESNV